MFHFCCRENKYSFGVFFQGRPPLAEKKKRTSSFSERKRGAKPKLKTGLGSTGPVSLYRKYFLTGF